MTVFDKKYYDNIWGTYADENGKQVSGLHRHDYTETLASRLIAKYGTCKILDIGTACGHLVKTLREKGCDAWGTEISQYALENSCAPEYVVKGDMRNLPFAADSFDVVHSQGVWGYFIEDDIPKALKECRRVGKYQEHNVDYDDYDPDHQYIVKKSREWWDKQFAIPKILVACPVHKVKEYSFQRWIDRVKEFTYPNVEIFVVDNSPTLDFYNKFKSQVPMEHIEIDPKVDYHRKITDSMAVIQKKFLAGDYYKWFNLECDVIPPKNMIELMLEWGKDTDWISHCYPMRASQGQKADVQQGIGCSMLSRPLVASVDYKMADSPDAWLWENVRKSKFTTMELWNYVSVEHLDK
jgi:ubiquinone/menaquinone biosynthesis C-methylase UbiE